MINSTNFSPELAIKKLKKNRIPFEKPNESYASVLVPFIFEASTWKLLFTQRAQSVKSHKGQISFPGGKAEIHDKDPEDTALREANEEIGLQRGNVIIYGSLPKVSSIEGYCIYPSVGEILKPFTVECEPQEVENVFTVPIDFLFDASNWSIQDYTPQIGTVHKVIFYKEFEDHLIWGITAKIITNLVRVLEQ